MTDTEHLYKLVEDYIPLCDIELIRKALYIASLAHHGYDRIGGMPYLSHAIGVASILAEWRAPAHIVAAGLLHDVPKPNYSNNPDMYGWPRCQDQKVTKIRWNEKQQQQRFSSKV